MTFRQRLRADCADRLEKICEAVRLNAINAVQASDSAINPYDVMRLITGGQTKTLRERLITELANEIEAELEQIYNRQIGLDLEDGNGVEKTED
ncbi:MAG: hypothetical protein AMJ84_00325 [Acidithiobacillales bacterium SM23_46]|nr:MAG: hypothetical protein AMJ84_00325 [Acidithiobacillales bacterium SM23_46]KPL29000.1 MAG: hypothetical protein AMJ72_00125 [Acidithiobacillales bacterium SM1_46]